LQYRTYTTESQSNQARKHAFRAWRTGERDLHEAAGAEAIPNPEFMLRRR
jgi:hypothetical protein